MQCSQIYQDLGPVQTTIIRAQKFCQLIRVRTVQYATWPTRMYLHKKQQNNPIHIHMWAHDIYISVGVVCKYTHIAAVVVKIEK